MNKYSRYTFILILTIVCIYVSIELKSIFIEIIIALFFWYFVKSTRGLLLKIPPLKKLPEVLNTIIAFFLLITFFVLFSFFLNQNIILIKKSVTLNQNKIIDLFNNIISNYNIDLNEYLENFLKKINYSNIISSIVSTFSSVLANTFNIVLYLVFFLLEEKTFNYKMKLMYTDKIKLEKVKKLLNKIDTSVKNYLFLKTIVSFITGFVSYFIILFFNIDAPFFWAVLIFILNFIPIIGSIVGSLFPVIFSLVQFADVNLAMFLLISLSSIQIIVGNIIEPKIMGNSMNISPLAVILTLSVWGYIWGIIGMLISVPMTVILIIILYEFKETKNISILLSEKGKL